MDPRSSIRAGGSTRSTIAASRRCGSWTRAANAIATSSTQARRAGRRTVIGSSTRPRGTRAEPRSGFAGWTPKERPPRSPASRTVRATRCGHRTASGSRSRAGSTKARISRASSCRIARTAQSGSADRRSSNGRGTDAIGPAMSIPAGRRSSWCPRKEARPASSLVARGITPAFPGAPMVRRSTSPRTANRTGTDRRTGRSRRSTRSGSRTEPSAG